MTVPDPAWVWGVDVAVERLDFAFIHRSGAYQINHVAVPPNLKGAARLASLYTCVGQFAHVMRAFCPPLIVYVERPTGQHPNPALDHAAGVAQASIYDALAAYWPFPVDVQLVAIADWKKKIGLSGNAGKPEVAAWAAERGYEGRQDGADALGVAACAALECGHGPGPTHIVHRKEDSPCAA
jgi:hypothetical protein